MVQEGGGRFANAKTSPKHRGKIYALATLDSKAMLAIAKPGELACAYQDVGGDQVVLVKVGTAMCNLRNVPTMAFNELDAEASAAKRKCSSRRNSS